MNRNKFQNDFNPNLLNGISNGGKPPFLHRIVDNVQNWCKTALQRFQNASSKRAERQEQKKIQALEDEDPLISHNNTQQNFNNNAAANGYNNYNYNYGNGNYNNGNYGNNQINPKAALTNHLGGISQGWNNPKIRNKWIKRASVAAFIVLCVGAGGSFGVHTYLHHISSANESSKSETKHVSFMAKAKPNSMIFTNGTQAGRTDKQGLYRFSDLPVHTKIFAVYGKTKSRMYQLTPADNHKTINIQFNCPSRQSVQNYMDKVYACLSNLINHNNPVSGNYSFDSFFATSQGEQTYHSLYSWGKKCNLQLDETPKPRIKIIRRRMPVGRRSRMRTFRVKTQAQPKFVQIGALQGIHFVKTVQNVSLNKDGSLIVRYRIETIYNHSHQDHITVYNWIAQIKKINGHWKIIKAQSAAKPVKSYNP